MGVRILEGHVIDVLRSLPAESVHCVWTSVPYWGLRAYGTEPQVWGGAEICEHEWGDELPGSNRGGSGTPTDKNGRGEGYGRDMARGTVCQRCGAWRGEHGLEPTLEMWLANEVTIWREVRRVLRKDGVCWLNCGDAYATSPSGSFDKGGRGGGALEGGVFRANKPISTAAKRVTAGKDRADVDVGGWGASDDSLRWRGVQGLASKQRLMLPARLAMELQKPFYSGKIKRETDRIWLAAMIDGEGCFYIHRRPAGQSTYDGSGRVRQNDTFSPALQVCNTSRAIVERVARIAGCGVMSEKQQKQTLYIWDARGDEARSIAREVYPHLVGKQHQCRLICGSPSNGPKATATWESLKSLHQGEKPTIDFDPPEPLWEPGFWLRDEVVWNKLNPMPSSVTDRTTPAHEMVYLLTKSPRYYYDAVAIMEPMADSSVQRLAQPSIDTQRGGPKQDQYEAAGLNGKSGSRRPNEIVKGLARKNEQAVNGGVLASASPRTGFNARWDAAEAHRKLNNQDEKLVAGEKWGARHDGWKATQADRAGRNKRSVWPLATEPWPEAHFATAPTMLVEPCLLAGTSARGCCAKCGAPWEREIEPTGHINGREPAHHPGNTPTKTDSTGWAPQNRPSGNWLPRCKCDAAVVPCRVLDIFGGSGTTGIVADRLGLDCILIELKPEYAAMARKRVAENLPGLPGLS